LALWKGFAPVVKTPLFGCGFCEYGTAGGCGESCGGFGGGRVWGRRCFLFRRRLLVCGTPDDEDVADALDGSGVEMLADACKQRLMLVALYSLNAYFDEFVCLYRTFQFSEYTGGEAVAGDGDDGIQGVGAGA
jgi:hypothetical protein